MTEYHSGSVHCFEEKVLHMETVHVLVKQKKTGENITIVIKTEYTCIAQNTLKLNLIKNIPMDAQY